MRRFYAALALMLWLWSVADKAAEYGISNEAQIIATAIVVAGALAGGDGK